MENRDFLKNAISIDQAIDELALDQKKIQDFLAPLCEFEVTVTDNEFALVDKRTKASFIPTDHCLNQMAVAGGMSSWAVRSLREPHTHPTKKDENGEPLVLWERDGRDAQVLADYINVHLLQSDRIDVNKKRLWRTWEDGTLRAFLSEQYARVNNRWYLQVLRSMLDDKAMVIRSGGNADTLYMDIFVGGEVQTADGGLGNMLHVGNSEIGERRIILTPSILRMICTNGMIGWSKLGEGEINVVHRRKRGQIDLTMLEKRVRESYAKVCDTFDSGMEMFKKLRDYKIGDVALHNVFAQLAIDNGFSKKQMKGIWGAWGVEQGVLGTDGARTAYALQNAITRYAQTATANPSEQYKCELIGGRLARDTNTNRWNAFLGRARNLDEKKIQKKLGKEIMT
jgi:hypothetical protein